MPKGKQLPKYFQLHSTQGENAATIYIYGFIGQTPEWYLEPELRSEEITAMAFVRELDKLSAKYDRINVRINSPGGMIFEGDAMVNAIANCSAEIHTYNDGLAASMAASIWLAGQHRHMATNAKLMLHSVSTYASGNARDLRAAVKMLDKMDDASIAGIAQASGMSPEAVRAEFFEDYEDHFLTHADVDGYGLLSEGESYEAVAAVENPEQMSRRELLQAFDQAMTADEGDQNGVFQLLRRLWPAAPRQQAKPTPNPAKTETVNIEDLRNAVKNGELSQEDLDTVLAEGKSTAEAQQATINAAVEAANAPLMKQLGELVTQVKELKASPGADPSNPGGGEGDDDDEGTAEFKQSAQAYATSAAKGSNPFVNAKAK